MKPVFVLFTCLMIFGCIEKKVNPGEYPISPVSFTKVKIADDFWAHRIKTNQEVTIPIAIQKSKETGRIKNFAIAGGLEEGEFCSAYPFDDSDIYKIIEGAAYSLQMYPDEKLESTIDSLIYLIGEAQEEDGYLYTNRTIMGENSHEWAGKKRWEKVDDLSHELYNLGHFYEAAVAYYQTTGKRKILDIAIKSANLIDGEFGYGKRENWPGHQEIEIGLVKLYRITGEKRYLNLAKFFLDIRGKDALGTKKTYNQSHIPVTEQTEAVGHSVRGAYMWSGMADVAAITGDINYVNAITKIWEDVVYKKLYITGGIGAEGGHEGFGGPYELPNMRAYCETCAAIANVFWNHRMFLMTGESRFIDVLERSLYNNVLSGVALDGKHFFYPNPLESRGQHQRSEWFGCACCPSNISRFIPSMPNYIYAQKNNQIYINLFVPSSTVFETKNGKLELKQESNMPWDGNTVVTLNPEKPLKSEIYIRIPGWASEHPLPGDLYSFIDKPQSKPVFKINGKATLPKIEEGYAIISGKWNAGDKIEIMLPYEIRKIAAHSEITNNKGKMALQLGPFVYCTEFADYEDPEILNIVLKKDAVLTHEFKADILNGVEIIRGDAIGTKKVNEKGDIESWPRKFTAIPYYGWAHRGKGQMEVWIPVTPEAAKPVPFPTIASSSKIETSHSNNGVRGINDQILPQNSADQNNILYHWWPKNNEVHWIIYNFEKPETVSESSVYWFKDTPNGGCDLPEYWKVFYKTGSRWLPVDTDISYPLKADEMNTISFKPVKTTALKLEVKLKKEYAAGIHEWIIK